MPTNTDQPVPALQLTRLLTCGWVAALAFIWLFHYGAWLWPVQLAHLLPAGLRFGPHFGEFCLRRLLDLLCVAGIIAGAFAVGATLLNRLIVERNLLTGLFALAAGLWVLAVVGLLLGAIAVRITPAVLLSLAGWLLPAPRAFWRREGAGSRPVDGWEKFLIAVLAVAVVLNLIGALAPPFEYDELEYHLGALADYQRAGRIVLLPHNFYSNLPQLTEMLYLPGLQMTGAGAAKLLHWSFGVLAAMAIYAVAVRFWTRSVGLTAAVMFYSLPFVQDLSQTARIDLATTFFGTLAFGGLMVWRKENGNWLWLSALAAGAAVATKWTAVPVVVLPCFIVIAAETRYFRLPAVFGLLAAVLVVPWLVKNWLLAGNPVYPLLDHLFQSPNWSPAQTALFAEKHFARFDGSWWEAPWRMFFSEPGATPVVLMAVSLILFLRPADQPVRRALALVGLAVAGWFLLTFRPWRFLLPAVPLAALAGAVALARVDRWTRAVVGAVMGVGLCWMAAVVLVDAEDPERVPPQMSLVSHALGQTTEGEFVARAGAGTFEPVVWMNGHLPASAKVFYVGEARVFYARRTAVWCTAFDRHPLAPVLRAPTDAGRLYAGLRAAGVTHVYVNFSEWDRLRRNYGYLLGMDSGAFRRMLQDPVYTRQIHAQGSKVVWELVAER